MLYGRMIRPTGVVYTMKMIFRVRGNGFGRTNEVTRRRARFVNTPMVTVFGRTLHLGM